MVAKYKKKKSHIAKSLIFPATLGAIILLLIGFLLNANFKLKEKATELNLEAATLGTKLQELKEQRDFLESEIYSSAGEDYLERIARDMRNLMKEGERAIVVLPHPDKDKELKEKEEN